MNDLVSVIMSTYDEPISYIKHALESIIEQTYKNLEIIIILDKPDEKEIKNYLNQVAKNEERIKFLVNKKNIGLSRTLNKAIKLSHGMYIARMDSDDISDKERLEKEITFLKSNNLDLVASNVQDIDIEGKSLGTGTKYPTDSKNIKRYLRFGDCMPHPTWFGKKDIFLSLNGYREINACEDYDFLIRATLSDFKLGLIEEPLLLYRLGYKGISGKNKSDQLLTSYCLQKAYKDGRIPTIEEIKIYKRMIKNKYFWIAFNKLKNKVFRKLNQ